jgi:hypothetical protein
MTVTVLPSDPEKNSCVQMDDVATSEKDMKASVPAGSGDYSGANASSVLLVLLVSSHPLRLFLYGGTRESELF